MMDYEIEVFDVGMKMPSASENKKNKQIAIDSWQFGPENPSLDPKANKPFWAALGKAWGNSGTGYNWLDQQIGLSK